VLSPEDGNQNDFASSDFSLNLFLESPSLIGGALPLERFLTPGYSEPTYFAPLFNEKNNGDAMETDERYRIGKLNAERVTGQSEGRRQPHA